MLGRPLCHPPREPIGHLLLVLGSQSVGRSKFWILHLRCSELMIQECRKLQSEIHLEGPYSAGYLLLDCVLGDDLHLHSRSAGHAILTKKVSRTSHFCFQGLWTFAFTIFPSNFTLSFNQTILRARLDTAPMSVNCSTQCV